MVTDRQIRLMEEMPDSISQDRCVLGQGIGLLAASAISTYSSIASFLPVALNFVKLAFHVGSAVDQAATRLSVDAGGVWSQKFARMAEDDLQSLLEIYKKKSVCLRCMLYGN